MNHRLSIDVFALAPETAESALGLKNLPAFLRASVKPHSGGLAGAVKHYATNAASQLVIVEDDGDTPTLIKRLENLAGVVEPGRKLIVIGAVNDITIYRQIISMGVADYLLSPASIGDLSAAIERATHDPAAQPKGKVISFYGIRGGVGSSTVAHNVAWLLSTQMKMRTILVDLDLAFGTAALAFNEEPRQPLIDALSDPERLDPILLQRFMVGENDDLQILSTHGMPRSSMILSQIAIEKLVDLSRQMADIIILDLPHYWANWVEDLLLLADETILVASLDLANLRDARNLVDLLRAKRGEEREARLVISKADMGKRSRLTVKDFTSTLSVQPLAQIPFDPTSFIEAVNDGKVISEKNRKHKATLAFQKIADIVSGRPQPARRLISWLPALKRQIAKPART